MICDKEIEKSYFNSIFIYFRLAYYLYRQGVNTFCAFRRSQKGSKLPNQQTF